MECLTSIGQVHEAIKLFSVPSNLSILLEETYSQENVTSSPLTASLINSVNVAVLHAIQGKLSESELLLTQIVNENPTCEIAKRNLLYVRLRLKQTEKIQSLLPT